LTGVGDDLGWEETGGAPHAGLPAAPAYWPQPSPPMTAHPPRYSDIGPSAFSAPHALPAPTAQPPVAEAPARTTN
jgi:hypothetical protein